MLSKAKYIFIAVCGFALLFPPAAISLSLSEIRTEARVLALDNGASRQRFSDSRVDAWINEAHRQVVLDIRPVVKPYNFELVVGTTYYDMPSDFLQMKRVTLNNDILDEITIAALDSNDRWQETGAEPTDYYIAFASRTKVGFYPYPSDTSSTGTVRCEYFASAELLDSDTDEPFGGSNELDQYGYSLAFFAAAHMSLIDGRSALGQFYLAEFKDSVERMKREANSRPSYRPGAKARNR